MINLSFISFVLRIDYQIQKSYEDTNDVQYPCILKCRYSSASQGLYIVNNEIELSKLISDYSLNNYFLE